VRQVAAYVSQNQAEFNFVNIPIQFNASFYPSSALDFVRADVMECALILHRHESILSRHEEILEEVRDLVKVIEVETRRLNPDAIHDITDAAEAELNEILHTIQEKRFPQPPSPEIDALLSQAIEKRKVLTHTAAPSPGEELTTR